MKYIYTIPLTFALLMLPTATFAQSVEFEVDDAGKLQDDYEAIKAKNSETPLFYIVKAKK